MYTPVVRALILTAGLVLAACGGPAAPVPADGVPPVGTFSIVAFDEKTGDLGVAVQSRFFGVGAVVPYAQADVGALATQALAEPTYGPDGLHYLQSGESAEQVVRRLTVRDEGRERRQLGVVDAEGLAVAFTGKETQAWAGHRIGDGYCCQGNILAGPQVVEAMGTAFEQSKGPLAERMVAALRAGQAAGGDKRGRQSAALLVVRRAGGYRGRNDRYVDLRVDDHPKPIKELERLLVLRRRSLGDAPVPERVAGLVREDWTAREPSDRAAESARSAWMRLDPGQALGATYVGTRRAPDKATIFYAPRGEHRLQQRTLVRVAGIWKLAP